VRAHELTADDYQALAEFRYQIRRFLHFSERAARVAGINPQQHQLLLAIKGLPSGVEPNIGEIAGRLHVRHHSAVELSDRLSIIGLVRKTRAKEDRRRVLLKITPRGEAVLRKLSLIHRAQLEAVGSSVIQTLKELIDDNAGLHGKTPSPKKRIRHSR